jgi:hypothetical protein
VIRRFLGTRHGLFVILAMEGLLLIIGLPRLLWNVSPGLYYVAFFGLATVFYFSNHRVWRWLQSPASSN